MGLHVGIIMDGNRRHAQENAAADGHRQGAEALRTLLSDLSNDDLGISELSLYAFSMENFQRPDTEKRQLFALFEEYAGKLNETIRERAKRTDKNVHVRFAGRLSLFPQRMHDLMLRLMEENRGSADYRVNLLMAYNGQDEIVDATRRIVRRKIPADDIDRTTIRENLYLPDTRPLDIVVRTGMNDGKRLSGFMLWQASYAEFFFLTKLWPAFTHADLRQVIEDYQQSRNRRHGR